MVLRVVKGSTLWGRAARVREWRAAAVLDAAPPMSVDSALSPVFAQLADALRYVHRQSGQRLQLTFGALLKARNVEQYLASMPQPAGTQDLSVERLWVDGQPPVGYELLGLYVCPPAQPDILRDDPVYRYFVSPVDLARAWVIGGARRGEYLPAFVGCADGAWLRLAWHSALPSASDTWLLLKNARLKPLGYVRQLAASGDVTVLVSSDAWRTLGRLDAHWQPGHGTRRDESHLAFGPLFSHPDDAARLARRRLGRGREDEYLGLVLVNAASTSFVALDPVRDTGIDSPLPRRLFQFESTLLDPAPPAPAYPAGFRLLAAHLFFQSMAATSDDSPADRLLGKHFVGRETLGFYRDLLRTGGVRGAFCYVSTRQGGLLKYGPRFTEREEQLFSGLIFGPPHYRPTQWLSRLASDGVLQVLDRDAYWTRSGVLKVEWSLEDGEERPVWQVPPADASREEL